VFGQRHLRQELRPRQTSIAGDEAILAEVLLVEED